MAVPALRRKRSSWARLVAGVAILLPIVTRPAGADTRVITVFTVQTRSQASPTIRTTQMRCETDIQGDHVRVAWDDGTVLLYDLRLKNVVAVDAATRTWRNVEGLAPPGAPRVGAFGGARFDVPLRFSVQHKDDTRTVAGLEGRSLGWRAEIDANASGGNGFKPEGMGGGGGPANTVTRSPFGIPVGTGPAPSDDESTPEPRAARGQFWLAACALPIDAFNLWCDRALPWWRHSRALLQILDRATADAGGFPVAMRLTLLTQDSDSVANEENGQMTMEVTSIETVPLDRMLFIVPSDYHRTGDQ